MIKTKYAEGTYAYHSTKVHYNKLEFKHLFHKMRFEEKKRIKKTIAKFLVAIKNR